MSHSLDDSCILKVNLLPHAKKLESLKDNTIPQKGLSTLRMGGPAKFQRNPYLISNILKRTSCVSPYSYDFNKLHRPFDLNGPLQCSNI